MPALVVPGVRVEAMFDILPLLPAPSGILGAVGIVDRPPQDGALISVTKVTEIGQLLGPGTVASMPEVSHALANGVSEIVIVAVAGGGPAEAKLLNAASDEVVRLRCRSKGASGNTLTAEVRTVTNAANEVVRATVNLVRGGQVLESFADLQVAPGQPDDLFEAINSQSTLVIAVDPGFSGVMPRPGTYAFSDVINEIKIQEPSPGTRNLLSMRPAQDADPVGLSVQIKNGAAGTVIVTVFQRGRQEKFPDLVMNPTAELSSLRVGERQPSRAFCSAGLPRYQRDADRHNSACRVCGRLVANGRAVSGGDQCLGGGYAYRSRVGVHRGRPRQWRSPADSPVAGGALRGNGRECGPRIAFGSITANEVRDLDQIREHSALVRNRRFALVAPPGAEGAVAGLVGRLDPQESPTFKPVPLFGINPSTFRDAELNRLLGSTTNLWNGSLRGTSSFRRGFPRDFDPRDQQSFEASLCPATHSWRLPLRCPGTSASPSAPVRRTIHARR